MRDKRRDSGEYYPGGRVIARPGTAPQQVVVQWSDVQGKPQVAPLPERYKDSDMKTKINEIAAKFATVIAAAFIGWSACADVTVQKKRKDEIYNDELVVVDVTGGGGSSMQTNDVAYIANHAISTNAETRNLSAKLAGKLPSTLSKTDKLYIENPSPLALPIPLIEYTTYDFIRPSKGWIWKEYVYFNKLLDKPSTLSGYGITDAYTSIDVDGKLTGKMDKMNSGDTMYDYVDKRGVNYVSDIAFGLVNGQNKGLRALDNEMWLSGVKVERTGGTPEGYDVACISDITEAVAANKPEWEDVPSNVVWRIEAEGGRFFFKPVRPVHTED